MFLGLLILHTQLTNSGLLILANLKVVPHPLFQSLDFTCDLLAVMVSSIEVGSQCVQIMCQSLNLVF
jgi:hypothetical protein